MKRISLFMIMLLLLSQGFSQDEKRLLVRLDQEDQEAMDALVMYPENVRNAIFVVAGQPDAIVRLDGLQELTASEFQELVVYYPRETQEQFYELVRYPELVVALVDAGKKTRQEIEDISLDYPEEVRNAARELGRNEFGTLIQIRQLQKEFRFALAQIKSDYDQRQQEAMDQLINLPEVLHLLTGNYRLTLLIGSLYEKDPVWVGQHMDSLALVQARANAKELEDWKKNLEEDPQALQELEASAEAFATNQGYDEKSYRRERTETVVIHHYNPYPYWFGYPYWYEYPFWYNYPYWYHWGFYYGPGGRIVIHSMPSWYYLSWHWYYPNHWNYYPHFSNCLVRHYDQHRNSSQSLSGTTRRWVNTHQNELGRDFVSRDQGRVQRIQEVARFETDYQNYAIQKGDKAVTRPAYLDRNIRKYPHLENSEQIKPAPTNQQPTDRPVRVTPSPQPRVEPRPTTREPIRQAPVYQPPRQATPPQTLPPKREIRINPTPTTRERINQGNQQHQQQWQPPKVQSKPAVSPPPANRQIIKPAKTGGGKIKPGG